MYTLVTPPGAIRAAGGDVLSSDNLLNPGSNIFFTDYGLVFKSTTKPIWINIWGNANDYSYFQSGPTSWYAYVSAAGTIAPETSVGYNPLWLTATIAILMVSGGYLLRRRQMA
jgi:hypothetical protein